jgi:hypothetical protein
MMKIPAFLRKNAQWVSLSLGAVASLVAYRWVNPATVAMASGFTWTTPITGGVGWVFPSNWASTVVQGVHPKGKTDFVHATGNWTAVSVGDNVMVVWEDSAGVQHEEHWVSTGLETGTATSSRLKLLAFQ